jgi:integrase
VSAAAWIFQKLEDVAKQGEQKASWYVGWYEPDGRRRKKSFGPGFLGKKRAEKEKHKLEEELTRGTYQTQARKLWQEFRTEYTDRVLAGLASRTRLQAEISLAHFERLVKPRRVSTLITQHIADFIALRRQEEGRRLGDLLSPFTLNKDLRHIKAALAVAVEWGYLTKLPKFRMEKEPGKLPTYVTGDHFASIYTACDHAKMPRGLTNATSADWWRALMVMGYMTGWRVGDMLAIRKDRLDLDNRTAVSLAEDNKGKRDELVKLHPVVVDHLRRLEGAWFPSSVVFPWNHNPRMLYTEFARIQKKAGIHLPCDKEHEHTPYCHVYGFHDLRRAFATMNADKLTADALQALMRHKTYATTQKYVNMARQMDEAVNRLHVPEVLKAKKPAQ